MIDKILDELIKMLPVIERSTRTLKDLLEKKLEIYENSILQEEFNTVENRVFTRFLRKDIETLNTFLGEIKELKKDSDQKCS